MGGATNSAFTPPIGISWTNYPTVDYATQAAYVDLARDLNGGANDLPSADADYVFTNLSVNGAAGYSCATNSKPFPPRYGARNK